MKSEQEPTEYSYFSNYIVAHIDLLGQQKYLKELSEYWLTDISDAIDTFEFKELIKKTLGAIDSLHDLIEKFLQTSCKEEPIPAVISCADREDYNQLNRHAEINIQPQADAIIINICLREQPPSAVMRSVYSVLLAIASLIPMQLVMENVIRGGIDLHWAGKSEYGDIYGPALYKAYMLEHEVAKYPRIAIGDGFTHYLEAFIDLKPSNQIEAFAHQMANWCGLLISEDEDKQYILDYLGQGFLDLMNDQTHDVPLMNDILPPAYSQIKLYLDKFSKEGNDRLVKRYNKLLKYYESRAPLWKDVGLDYMSGGQ